MDKSNRRIVILGKTGAGKSSLANTIFGEEMFKIDHTASSGTSKCEAKTKSVNGRSITLIDCPGFFDTNKSEEELKREIVKCIIECAPGPHAFLIVLKVEKFTELEKAVINRISKYFSEEAFKYATVVFTHGDQLLEGQTIDDFVRQNKPLSDLMKKCGGRCHVIDNKYWNQKPKDDYRSNQFQVEELLNTIEKMVMENNGSFYTNEILQAVEKAKASGSSNLRATLAGIGIGVLLGALCGAGYVFKKGLRSPQGAVVVVVSAVVGGVLGGVVGYFVSKGADTTWVAMENAAMAVMNETEGAFSEEVVIGKYFYKILNS